MTTRTRNRLAGLLTPRRRRMRALGSDYGRDQLDNSWLEVQPYYHRDAAGDDPWLSPLKSEAVMALTILIAHAQAHTINTTTSSNLDLRGFCEDAELTERQTEVIVLTGEGWTQRKIAEWLQLSQATVWQHLHHGRHKLAGRLPLLAAMGLTNTYQEAY